MEMMTHSSTFLLPSIPTDNGPSPTYALVVLNQRLPRFTPLLWKHAQLRICADGGANRLYDELPQLLPHEDVPDLRNSVFGLRDLERKERKREENSVSPTFGCNKRRERVRKRERPDHLRPQFCFSPEVARFREKERSSSTAGGSCGSHLIGSSSNLHHSLRLFKVNPDLSKNLSFEALFWPPECRRKKLSRRNGRYKPDVIKGDMDSVRREVIDFYANLGTKIVDESDDQDTTDLNKCVAFIRDCTPNLEKSNLRILVAGALGGRFDHEIGNINVLCRFSTMQIVLLSDDCLIQLLPKTHLHEIHIQSSVEGPHCGLVPIGMPSGSTTTTGLQWDLNHTEMRFGGLISTSNIVKEETITVQSDSDLLWTISIKKF